MTRVNRRHAYGLTLKVADRTDLTRAKELETARMDTPPSRVIGIPASAATTNSETNAMAISIAPEAKSVAAFMLLSRMNWISRNPSSGNNSLTTCSGAEQIPGVSNSRIRVVSGGGSAASELRSRPRYPAVPASATFVRNSLRLQPSDCRLLTRTSFFRGLVAPSLNTIP